MDLNELPPDFDFDLLEDNNEVNGTLNPSFCTQPDPTHLNVPTISEVRLSLEQTILEDTEHDSIHGTQDVRENTIIAGDVRENTIIAGEATQFEVAGGVDADEVWSTPPVPYNGQSFASKQEARDFYNAYAKRIGFSIRTNTSRLTAVTREQRKVHFVCNKEGKGWRRKVEEPAGEPSSDEGNSDGLYSDHENIGVAETNDEATEKKKLDGGKKRKREKMQYTGCKARMVVKLVGERWHVVYFTPDHNHDLVVKPSLKKFLRSHKGIPKQEKDFITLLHGCNLTTGRIMQLMNEFYGSEQLVPYEGKDVGNFRSTIRRTEKYKDMQETLDRFRQLEQEDPEFFHKFKLDAEHRVECLFWVDSLARHAYIESYHDCVSFDATYMTNMYDMPFAPFIGINRHGQSFQLGCAFIRDEKTPTYIWLFQTFLEAMKGKAPLNIITDQDGAMRSAIALVLPSTTHRNCRWHIMDKFSGTIGPLLAADPELEEDFKDCVNHTVTPAEFEVKWAAMINKFGLQENPHFERLYAIRASFVPAYYMHNFFPFLQSTQRSEGYNAVLKKYVNPNMSLLHFVEQYQKIQDKCLVAQGGQDFRTDENERRRWSRYPIEKHAATVYTKNLFYRFSKEFEKTAEYDVKPEAQSQYWLVPNNKFVYGYGKRDYLVTAIEDEDTYFCECSKFDRDGILCCHILKIMTRLGVKTIPERYIKKRWTQQAVSTNENASNNGHVEADLVARGMPLSNRKTLWFTNISTSFADLAVKGCVSNETYTVVENHIRMMRSELDEIKKRKSDGAASRSTTDSILPVIGNSIAAPDTHGALQNNIGAAAEIHGVNTAPTQGTSVLTPLFSAAGPSYTGAAEGSTPTVGAVGAEIGNPPRSKVKGRKKEKRLKKGMNAEPKRKNRCSICKSTTHTAPRCPQKKIADPGAMGAQQQTTTT